MEKTENTHKEFFNEDYYLEKEIRTLRGCRRGLLIILGITILFWCLIFQLIKHL